MRAAITPLQERFAEARLYGATGTHAARLAGAKYPNGDSFGLMRNPKILEATRAKAQQLVEEKAGYVAVTVLMELALDDKQPGAVRRGAATDLGKFSGIGVEKGLVEKDLHEMTNDELQAHLRLMRAKASALETAISDKAKPIIDVKAQHEHDAFD